MIVNSRDSGWEILYQRSHAMLAAELVSLWRDDQRPERWTETVVAIAQHDDQENFWEGKHLSQIGAPLDFTQVDLNTNQIRARTVIDNAYQQSLWIALMISHHNSFLYEDMRGQDTKMDAFLDEQREKQKAWVKLLGVSKDAVERGYALVRWGDRLSLILCKRELPDKERWLEISPMPDGQSARVMQRADESITLDPWPYTVDRVRFSAEARKLKQLQFASEDEFRKALEGAAVEFRTWEFVR
jgi:hypothetical protein